MVCIKSPNSFILLNNVFLHIFILFIIVTCLFLFYIQKLSKNEMNHQFNNLINKNLSVDNLSKTDKTKLLKTTLKLFLSKNKYEELFNNFSNSTNKTAEQNNTKLKEELFIIIFFLSICVILINLVPRLFFNYCNGLGTLLIELIVVFICVGFIEVWFFTNIASKYIPVKPSFITEHLFSLFSST